MFYFLFQVVEADIFSESSIQPYFEGQDAVMSCLGIRDGVGWLQPVTFYSDSIKPITAALKGAKVNRFITMTTWCTKGKIEKFINFGRLNLTIVSFQLSNKTKNIINLCCMH